MQLRCRVKRSLGPLKEAIHYCTNKVDKWLFSVQFIDGVIVESKFVSNTTALVCMLVKLFELFTVIYEQCCEW